MSFLETALSLILLLIASERIVEGSLRLSVRMGLPKVVVGVVVLGFSGGLPELTAAGFASYHKLGGLALGSVVGSITINTTLVLGAAALINPISIRSGLMKREGALALITSLAFAIICLFRVSLPIAITEIVAFLVITAYLVKSTQPEDVSEFAKEAGLEQEAEQRRRRFLPLGPLGDLVLGLVLMLAGAELLVTGINGLIIQFRVDQGVAGALLVATGSSLPELLNAIAAARKKEPEIVVGNVLGAVLFNATAVVGLSGIFHTASLSRAILTVPLPFMLLDIAACMLFLTTGNRVRRSEAIVLLALYVGSVAVTAFA